MQELNLRRIQMRYTILLQLVLTKQSVRLLEKYEINLNSPANGVFLPYQTNEFVTTEVMHMDLYNPKETPVILLRDTYGETPHQYITKKQFERKRLLHRFLPGYRNLIKFHNPYIF